MHIQLFLATTDCAGVIGKTGVGTGVMGRVTAALKGGGGRTSLVKGSREEIGKERRRE